MFKVLSKILIIAMFGIMFIPNNAYAQSLNKDFLNEQIAQQVTKQLKNKVKGDLSIQLATVPFEQIIVPEGSVCVKAIIKDEELTPRKIVEVEIWVNNQLNKKLNLPVDLKVYDNVWIASNIISRDKNFNPSNVAIDRKDITNDYDNVMRSEDDIENYVANKNFRISEIINKKFIKQKPDILKNTTVSAIFESDSIQVAIDAQALESASVGDSIRIKSPKYNRYYVGEVISKNVVLVRL